MPSLRQSTKVLALEDTSTLSYQHGVAKQLGTTGPRKTSKNRGVLAHSVLMVDANTEKTLGLGEQYLWCRKDENFDQRDGDCQFGHCSVIDLLISYQNSGYLRVFRGSFLFRK